MKITRGENDMTAKEYLNSVRNADKLINLKNDELYYLSLKFAQISSQTITDRVLSSNSTDAMKIIDKIIDLEKEINTDIDNLVDLKKEARKKINKLSDSRYIAVLTEYYINCKTWGQVAKDTGYDLRWVYRLHSKALQAFSKIFK